MNNRIKEAFDKVQVNDTLKQNTLKYVLQKTQKKPFVSYKRIAVLATALLLLTVCFLFCVAYFTPISVISVDVNPSIELEINRFDKVIKAKAFNDDGERILSSAKVRFMGYKEAVATLLKSNDMSEYMTEDDLVCITVFDDKEEKQQKILCEIENCTKDYKNISYSSEKPEKVKGAHKEGLSYGKFKAFLDLKDCEPETTVDEVRDSSMKEIHDKIDAHKKHHGGKGEPPKENNNNKDECFDASSGDDTNVTNGENPNPDEPKPKPDGENPNPDEPNPKPDGENPNPDEPKPRPDGENPNSDEPNPKPDGNFDNGNGNGKQQQNQNRPTPNNQAPDDNKESTPPEKVPDESLLSNNENEPIMTKDFVHNQIPDMNENGGYGANTFNGLNGNRDEKGYYESDCIPTPDTDRNGNPSAFPPKNFGN